MVLEIAFIGDQIPEKKALFILLSLLGVWNAYLVCLHRYFSLKRMHKYWKLYATLKNIKILLFPPSIQFVGEQSLIKL